MFEQEDAYGLRKRFEFVRELIARRQPHSVIEVGCGSGAHLSYPLAEVFPAVQFTGIDPDAASIGHARSLPRLPNLRYLVGFEPLDSHDFLIASEVIEHVESPLEFLVSLRKRLNPGGNIVLTTPNGYGPFEFASLAQVLLTQAGVMPVMQRLWRRARGRTPAPIALRDSYAVSPHINFFSWRDINRAIDSAGLKVETYRGRTWLCGFGLDVLVRHPLIASMNARLADHLPAGLVSDWMFVLAPVRPPAGGDYVRNRWARFRRSLNEKAIARQAP